MATPAATYGAMLAGVDYVLVGAGIPAEFPALLDELAAGHAGEIAVDVLGGGAESLTVPVCREADSGMGHELRRPRVPSHRRLARTGLLSSPANRELARTGSLSRDPWPADTTLRPGVH